MWLYQLPHYARFVVFLGGSGSDTAEIIRRRHAFFLACVIPQITLKQLDPKRLFDGLEKELIWSRDGRKCKNPDCNRQVPFHEARIHHVVEHSVGGATVLNNGILVCSECHTDRKHMQNPTSTFQEYLEHLTLVGGQDTPLLEGYGGRVAILHVNADE